MLWRGGGGGVFFCVLEGGLTMSLAKLPQPHPHPPTAPSNMQTACANRNESKCKLQNKDCVHGDLNSP